MTLYICVSCKKSCSEAELKEFGCFKKEHSLIFLGKEKSFLTQEYSKEIPLQSSDEIKLLNKQVGLSNVSGDLIALEYEDMLVHKDDHFDALLGLGKLYYSKSEFKKSKSYLDKLVYYYPDESIGYKHLAELYLQIKEYQKSVDMVKKCIEIEGKTGPLFYNLGFAQCINNQFSEAINSLKKAVHLTKKRELKEKYELFLDTLLTELSDNGFKF